MEKHIRHTYHSKVEYFIYILIHFWKGSLNHCDRHEQDITVKYCTLPTLQIFFLFLGGAVARRTLHLISPRLPGPRQPPNTGF